MSAPDPSAVHANAYAIAYRLLGDRPAAQAAVGIAVERSQADGTLERPDWMCGLAEAAVAASVGAAAGAVAGREHRRADSDGIRESLRRRLASASVEQRTAGALHHLAGYPIDAVASFMGRPSEEVSRLASSIAPPPGVSYRSLGDPELLGAVTRSRPSRRLPRVSISTAATVVLVLAIVVGVSRCVGPRPRLGPAPRAQRVVVGPDVAPVPSKGCSLPARSGGTFDATAGGGAGPAVSFRLSVPDESVPSPIPTATDPTGSSSTTAGDRPVPRPLLVAVTDADTDIDTFLAATGVESTALEAGWVLATVSPTAATSAAVEETSEVLAEVREHTCVDTARVTVAGHGTGAQVATSLACVHPSSVAVAVGVGGAAMPGRCRLSPAVSLLLLWNADDAVFPPSGGHPASSSVAPSGEPLPADAPGQVVVDWARAIGAPAPTRTTAPDSTVVESGAAASGAEARWVTSPSGGHAWPPVATDSVLAFAAAHARRV